MKHHRLAGGLLAAFVLAAIGAPQAGAAQVDYHLELDPIASDVEVQSFSWGLNQQGAQRSGSGGGAGKVNVQDISFTKYVDKSSPLLMLAVAKGQQFPCATLRARLADGTSGQQAFVFKMEKVLVSSYQTSGDAGEMPTETISLNFTNITFDFSWQTDDGQARKTSASWDFLTRRQFEPNC